MPRADFIYECQFIGKPPAHFTVKHEMEKHIGKRNREELLSILRYKDEGGNARWMHDPIDPEEPIKGTLEEDGTVTFRPTMA